MFLGEVYDHVSVIIFLVRLKREVSGLGSDEQATRAVRNTVSTALMVNLKL